MSEALGRAVDGRADLVPTGNPAGLIARLARGLWRLPSLTALGLVRVYQLTLSPMLGPSCRFHPSCSHYACACLRDHGLVWGGALTVRRIVRCQPFHPGGFDPPPPPRTQSLWARWVLRTASASDGSPATLGASPRDHAVSGSDEPSGLSTLQTRPTRREVPDAAAPSQPSAPHVVAPHDLLRGAP